MSISFIRIDDRIIHGQIIIRWSKERPCDGILAVNDHAASNAIVKNALKAASEYRVLVYTTEEFLTRMADAIASDKRYFLITKDPATMLTILSAPGFAAEVDVVNVGPQSARVGTRNVNKNADITAEEAAVYRQIAALGWDIDFRLVPDGKSVNWKSVSSQFTEE